MASDAEGRLAGGARVAISLVLNYEEGGENRLSMAMRNPEAFLSDIAGRLWAGSGTGTWNPSMNTVRAPVSALTA
ncbi:MAG: hypothetical protein R3D60_05760 [Paracoccaceae bacterium]